MLRIETRADIRDRLTSAARQRRLAILEQWLAGQVTLRQDRVALPASLRSYAIRIPTESSRESLFAQARAEPGQVLPHWTKVWASGMALADVVLSRRHTLAGRNVLELGSGLGVTATAALEAGARVHAMDYSPLALAFCRVNALLNTGRAPSTLAVNWAVPDRPVMARAEALGGFTVILAADVLYESRDIDPLLVTIERLLAPDGELWLAEPCRQTAQRFLSMVSLAGWHGESIQVVGPWHDGKADPVNIHFLRRPSSVDVLQSTLGGWRA